jgi:hypothetical protein
VIPPDQLGLELFKLNLDVCEMALRRRAAGGADMQSIHRSDLTRSLMTGAAALALVMIGAPGVRAEIVTVQGDDGAAGADGVNLGDNGMPGGEGESVTGSAGSAQPITAPLNQATTTGGNGGGGGNGVAVGDGNGGFGGNGGNGGNGGSSDATAVTATASGLAEADAHSTGGNGGSGGLSLSSFGSNGNGTAALALRQQLRAPRRMRMGTQSPATRSRKVASAVVSGGSKAPST